MILKDEVREVRGKKRNDDQQQKPKEGFVRTVEVVNHSAELFFLRKSLLGKYGQYYKKSDYYQNH